MIMSKFNLVRQLEGYIGEIKSDGFAKMERVKINNNCIYNDWHY